MREIPERIDEVRRLKGFLTIEETLRLADLDVTIVDPFSTLISRRVSLAPGIFIWPNVTLEVGPEAAVSIGASTVLHGGVRIAAGAGSIAIGANGDVGQEGGFTFVTSAPNDRIHIGNDVRLNGGGSIAGSARLGDGAQVLGPIRIQNCQLGAGGPFESLIRTNAEGSSKAAALPETSMSQAVWSFRRLGCFQKRRSGGSPISIRE